MGNYAGLVVDGGSSFDSLGASVSGIGDFNGDGIDDFIVGAPRATDIDSYQFNGSAYIVFGTVDGPATLNVNELDGTNGFRITPENATGDGLRPIGDGIYVYGSYVSSFGSFVAGIGDVNGDGLADVAVAGRTGYYNNYGRDLLERPNAIFVIFGTSAVQPEEISVASLDGTNGFQIFGTGGLLNGIEAAGDVNNDGVDDFLISQSPVPSGQGGFYGIASAIDAGGPVVASSIGEEDPNKGAAGFVIFGNSALGAGGGFRIDDLDGANGFEMLVGRSNYGGGYYGELGFYGNDFRSFSTAIGDVNGDGFADIAVRTLVQTRTVTPVYDDQGYFQYNNYETTQEGRLHIVLGRAAPDLNGDGRPESVDTTFYDFSAGAEDGVVEVFWGPASGYYNGSQSLFENVNVRGVGDINGDGFADVAVSQPNINRVYGEDRSIGYVDVFFGGPDAPDPFAQPDLRIVKLDNTLDYLGQAITGIGDVNGDGVDDFAISAPRTSFLETVADGVFIVFGSTNGPTQIDLDLIGQQGGDSLGYRIFSSDSTLFDRSAFGEVISAAGDLNGDGFADLLIGAQYADVDTVAFGGTNAGRAFVVYGGAEALEAADNADGIDDNVIDIANIVVDVDTGVVPIVVSVANAGLVGVSRSEGNAGETIFAFEVRRTGDLTEAVSFDFAVTPLDSSLNGADFAGGVLPTGTASFASGAATTIVEIAVQGDVDIESSEVFAFTISNAISETSPISIGAAQTLGRIVNDDFPIRFFAQDASVFEGNPGDDNVLTFTVTRTGPGFAASVDFAVTGNSIFPVDAADFEPGEFPLSGTLDFAAGEFSKTISLRVAEDFDIESSERALLTLSNPRSDDALVLISDGFAIGTVRNDDFAPEIFISGDTFVLEGNPGSDRGFNFTIERRGDFNGPVEITYVINPSPAPGDFFAADAADLEAGLPQGPFTVTIPDGQASVSFRVNIAEDFVIEPRESFSVSIVSVDRPEGGVIYDVIRPSITATILNDDGRPPVIPPGIEADVFGDPHIITLDGLGYDFQAVGEYILVETLPGAENPFQVQVRFEPLPGSDLVSVTTRMAVKIGDITVEIDATGPELLLVDGEGLTDSLFALGALDADGDGEPDIFFDEATSMIFLVLNDADEQLAIKAMDGTLNICVFLSSEEGGNAGNVRGLMGDGDGDGTTADDLALRNGTPLTQPVDFDVIYGDYANSWRLDGSDGKAPLFSNAVTFPENFPAAVITLDDLPVELREAAEAAALAAGLDPENTAVFEGAVLDFALTGNPNFIQGATGLVADTTATTDPANAPALPAVVGVTVADPNEDFVEGDDGEQSAVFTFYRIGDTSGALTVSYSIGGDVDADDLGAAQGLAGEVTFAAGETSVSILVAVAGDLTTEDDEALTVTITGVSDETALIAGPSATKTILTDDFAPEAADDVFTTTEDARVAGNLLAPNRDTADTDADGDSLTVVSVTSSTGVERAVAASTGTGLFILASGAHLRVNADGSFTYDPFGFGFSGASSLTDFDRLDDGEIGVETFTYEVSDGNGGFDDATVTITVNGVNDAPIAVIDSINVTEDDEQGSVNLLNGNIGPDVDPEGGPLTITEISVNGQSVAVDPLAGGTLTLASGASITVLADGTATFFTNGAFEDLGDQPGQLVQRNINFTYTVADEKGLTDTALLQVFVAGVNDAPEIDPIEAAFLADDEGRAINLLDGAFDEEGDDLTAEDISVEGPGGLPLAFDFDPETGVLMLGDGQFGGLAEGETATVIVSYVVSDGAAETPNSATITITGVAAPNSPPVAVDDDYTTGFGDDLNIGAGEGLLANDSDPDFDALTVVGFQQAANGELSVFPDGSFTYTPDASFFGTETILYTISDGFAVATATLSIVVEANGTPVAVDDDYTTGFGDDLNIGAGEGLLANDSDPDFDALTVVGFQQAANGELSVFPDGSFTYTPDAGFFGTETILYTISDGFAVATATLSIVVEANGTPVAVDDDYTTGFGDDLNIGAGEGLLANDSDPDFDPISVVGFQQAANGELAVFPDGSFTYTPDAGFAGTETILYTISDGFAFATATLSIVVEANGLPVAVDDDYTTGFGDDLNIGAGEGLLANDSDPDFDPISVVGFQQAANGELAVFPDGSFTYTPDAGFAGTETILYTISDGFAVATATLSIVVEANGLPVAVDDDYTTGFGDDLNIGMGEGLLSNDSDPDFDPIEVVAVGSAANGDLNVFPDGSFTYTPDAGFAGAETILYTISDGFAFATATLSIVVEENGTPVAVDDDYTTGFEDDLNVGADEGLLSNDSDPDFDPIEIVAVGSAANGDLNVFPDGSFSYTPDAGFAGMETILYTISDGFAVATATLSIVVAGEEDRPFIFGTEGNDRLVSPNTGAIIDGGEGRDNFIAGAAADTFILSDGDGDQFRRFDASMDKLDISAWGVESFEELTIFDRVGRNPEARLITIYHGETKNLAFHYEIGDRLSAADFTADNFIFADPLNLA